MLDRLIKKDSTRLFHKFILIIPEIEKINEAAKSKSDGFMDFNIDILEATKYGTKIALSHYYKHNSGDMIADPDMTFMLNMKEQWIEPLSYQDMYKYDEVYSDDYTKFRPHLRQSLLEFSLMWFDNLYAQGHIIKS